MESKQISAQAIYLLNLFNAPSESLLPEYGVEAPILVDTRLHPHSYVAEDAGTLAYFENTAITKFWLQVNKLGLSLEEVSACFVVGPEHRRYLRYCPMFRAGFDHGGKDNASRPLCWDLFALGSTEAVVRRFDFLHSPSYEAYLNRGYPKRSSDDSSSGDDDTE